MKALKLWLSLFVVLLIAAGGGYLWWDNAVRWRPHVITRSPLEVARILERAGWVSPGLPGPKLYMISFRDCTDCQRFEREIFPRLHAAGVDTRVIMVARPDAEGVSRSSPAERTTVAELWANRSWRLWQDWHAGAPQAWTAPGLTPADTDTGRAALVEAGRRMVTTLQPLLAENGVNFAYPLLVWQTRDGALHACACESPRTYRYLLDELGVPPA